MKRKGITIWELYLERFVLAAAAIFFVGFTAFQFLRHPNVVQDIAPGDIDNQLRTVADQVAVPLTDGAAPTAKIPEYQPVLDRFTVAIHSGITPKDAVALRIYSPAPTAGEARSGENEPVFYVPVFAAAETVVAGQNYGAIDPETVANDEDLTARFTEAPHDVWWVTTYAVVPMAAYREELERSSGDLAAIPANWHGGRIDLLDLVVEREEYVDGTWGELTTLDPLPGQFTFRPVMADTPTKRDRDDILEELRLPGARETLVRPPFYPLISEQWSPIDPRLAGEGDESEIELTEEQRELSRLMRRLNRKAQDVADVERELNGMDAPLEPPAPERKRGSGSGSGGEGEKGEGGGRRTAPGGQAPPGGSGGFGSGPGAGSGAKDPQVERQKLLQRLWSKRKTAVKGLTSITRRVNDKRLELGLAPLGEDEVRIEVIDDLMMADELVVWFHDLDVSEGSTYRYRMTVEVNNPFFARKLDLSPDQQSLAETITLSSSASDWSDSIEVNPPTRLFVTKAHGENNVRGGSLLNMGKASVEVFHFRAGRWWKQVFQVEPGQRIGETRQPRRGGLDAPREIDYGTAWMVLDIVADLDASQDQVKAGYGAKVLLQHARDGTRIVTLDPQRSRDDPERQRLIQAVEAAEEALEVAASG